MATVDADVPFGAQAGWQEMTSGNGNKYHVKAEDYDVTQKTDDDTTAASGPPFDNLKVSWKPNTEGLLPQHEQDISGITYYKYSEAPWWSPSTWQLTISTRDTYNYVFTDKTGDTYSLGVWQNGGSHYVGISSNDPEITTIRGA